MEHYGHGTPSTADTLFDYRGIGPSWTGLLRCTARDAHLPHAPHTWSNLRGNVFGCTGGVEVSDD